MDGQTGGFVSLKGQYVPASDRFQHLGSRHRHVFAQGEFVFAVCAVNPEGGNSPGIELFPVELDVIVVIGQAFAKTKETEPPRARLAQGLLEIGSEPRLYDAPVPPVPMTTALKSISTQKVFLFRFHVAKAWHVGPIRPPADFEPVFVSGNQGGGSARADMVHQVVAEFATRVCQTLGKLRGSRIEQDAGGLERGSTEKDHAGPELNRGP